MKKYLRLLIEIVMGLLLAGALAFSYWSYNGKAHAIDELTDVSEGVDEAKQELEKVNKELAETKEKADSFEPAARELAAVKGSFETAWSCKTMRLSSRRKKGLSSASDSWAWVLCVC